jgi:hypothetical protein
MTLPSLQFALLSLNEVEKLGRFRNARPHVAKKSLKMQGPYSQNFLRKFLKSL